MQIEVGLVVYQQYIWLCGWIVLDIGGDVDVVDYELFLMYGWIGFGCLCLCVVVGEWCGEQMGGVFYGMLWCQVFVQCEVGVQGGEFEMYGKIVVMGD